MHDHTSKGLNNDENISRERVFYVYFSVPNIFLPIVKDNNSVWPGLGGAYSRQEIKAVIIHIFTNTFILH